MSVVLGVSCHYHEAAAALVVDGQLIAALSEERLSRVKNDPSLPVRAIRAVLAQAGVEAGALDQVVFYENPYAKLERVMVHALRQFPRAVRSFGPMLASQLGDKLWVQDRLAKHLGVPRGRVSFVTHHESHAASALYTAPWAEDTAFVTADGVGEWATTSLGRRGSDGPELVEQLEWPHSLGMLYAGLTAWLGFAVNEGEYKVMGLAAYGRPTRRDAFASLITLHDDGAFAIHPERFGGFTDLARSFGPGLEALLGPARPLGRPWDLSRPEDQARADVAATLQAVVEEAMVALARRVRRATDARYLCLAGGVALNVVANHRVAREAGFDAVYVHPAAGDAGGAVGAAYMGALRAGDAPTPPADMFLGLATQPAHVADVARELGLSVTRLDDPDEEVARRLAQDELVGRCSGRGAWGPRALGARSLLARPERAATRDHVNRRVKHREAFRPFAPAVLASDFGTYFEGAPDAMTACMTTVRDVRTPDALAAVTHVDGTARVQSVEEGEPLAGVLQGLARGGLPPVVLNTSLNGPGSPIVGTGIDALAFMLRHPIDYLVVDDVGIGR